jgi:DNA-binding PadR family transcriptional regulator
MSAINASASFPEPSSTDQLATAADPGGRGRIKFALLAFLLAGPRHGYELRSNWESLLGEIWPLKAPQIYTTLKQMERDGLVETEVVPQDLMPPKKICHLTDKGRELLQSWLAQPVETSHQLRDDFVLKVLFAVTPDLAGDLPARDILRRHRASCIRALKELQEVRSTVLDTTSQLLTEAAMIRMEGNLRWIDRCEEMVGTSD